MRHCIYVERFGTLYFLYLLFCLITLLNVYHMLLNPLQKYKTLCYLLQYINVTAMVRI